MLEEGQRITSKNRPKFLEELDEEKAIDFLNNNLLNGKILFRNDAIIEELGKRKVKEAIPLLIKILESRAYPEEYSSRVKIITIRALAEIGDERVIEPLINTLKYYHTFLRTEAVIALGKLGDKRAVEPLIELLDLNQGDDYFVDYFEVIAALGLLADERAIEPLLNFQKRKRDEKLHDLPELEIQWITIALGQIGENSKSQPLIDALKTVDYETSRYIAEALGEIRCKEAIIPLLDYISKESNLEIYAFWEVFETLEKLGAIKQIKQQIILDFCEELDLEVENKNKKRVYFSEKYDLGLIFLKWALLNPLYVDELNMQLLNLSPKDIDLVVISHSHWDHCGGLARLLYLNSKLKVYVPKSFSKHLKEEIEKRADIYEVRKSTDINSEIYTTGEIEGSFISGKT